MCSFRCTKMGKCALWIFNRKRMGSLRDYPFSFCIFALIRARGYSVSAKKERSFFVLRSTFRNFAFLSPLMAEGREEENLNYKHERIRR